MVIGMDAIKAKLILEDGSEFAGFSFGKARPVCGEVVFTTGMTGYPQALTDPSFYGQILVATYPLVGNYGIPAKPDGGAFFDENRLPLYFESERPHVAAFIVAENCEQPSHYDARLTLAAWLEKNNVPALCGVDTRAITKRLRSRGVMRGTVLIEGEGAAAGTPDAALPLSAGTLDAGHQVAAGSHQVAAVSCTELVRYRVPGGGKAPRIVLVDCGVKANILRCLLAGGAELIRVPWDYDIAGLEYDGLFLSNGPGDPKACGKTIAALRRAFARGKPVFGVCLGVQIMALAAGADTYKLPYGHRSANQPCIEKGSGRCYITSQNHGYAVRAETLPADWEVWFTNANDGTVEGIRAKNAPFSAVQFHPEGCPGPRDTEFLMRQFLERAASA
jgi:carbamoyl-phosphate synthase small subunit